MKILNTLTLFLITCLTLSAQENINPHWEAFHRAEINYFFTGPASSNPSTLSRALANDISGNTDSVSLLLRKYLKKEKLSAAERTYALNMLYEALVQDRDYPAALALNRQESLKRSDTASIIFLQQFAAPTFTGTGATTVAFDRYYIDAMIGTDSVRIFLDTGAPGVTVDATFADKYNWPLDTTRTGNIAEPYVGIEYQVVPTLIHRLSIGTFTFQNIPASAFRFTEEMWQKKTAFGIKRYAIIMGIGMFSDLIDGLELDYENGQLKLFAELPESTVNPNYRMIEGKPVINFSVGTQKQAAFLDSGSPRHAFTRAIIQEVDTLSSYQDNYGSYYYDVYRLALPELLGQKDLVLEATGNARRVTGDPYNISAHFGSFLGYRLFYDLRNRHVSLRLP